MKRLNSSDRALMDLLITGFETATAKQDEGRYFKGLADGYRSAIAYMTGTHDMPVEGDNVPEWLPGLKEQCKQY